MKRNHKMLISSILVIILCLCQCIPAIAKETDDYKTVRVACGINKSLYFNGDGKIEGYCSEYLTDLAEINHWNLEYVEASWNDSVQNLYDGKVDLLFPTQMTEERKEKMGFSTAIGGYQPIGLYARADSDLCFDDFEGFEGARVAVSAGTSNEQVLKQYAADNHFTYKTVYLNTADEKEAALKDGSVDMIVFSTLNDVPDGKVVSMLDYLPFYYCTRIDDTELLNELNYGMNQMIVRHSDVVENVFYSFMNKNISFAYTTEEQAEIEKKGSITIGVYKDTAPLFDVDKDGNSTGIYVDLIHKIEEISGLNIEIKALDRNEVAFDYLNHGDTDFVMGSSDQGAIYSNEKEYNQSEGIMDYYTVAVTKADFNMTESDNITFALTNGRKYWVQIIQKECPNASFVYYTTSKECLEAVQSGKADATMINTWEYNYQSKNKRFENLIEWENSRVLSQTVFISLADENEYIRTVINKSIEQISNAEKEGIITANLNIPYADYNLTDKIYEARQTIIISISIFVVLIVAFAVYLYMRRKSIHELEKSNLQLKEANESKDVFLSRMSHELRTPLNAINGYADIQEENITSDSIDKNLLLQGVHTTKRATNYLLAIINDLLDIQCIEMGKLKIHKIEVAATDYMNDVVHMIKDEADIKNIDFQYNRTTNNGEYYLLDGVRLQQILLNLSHNAIKFTPEGGKVIISSKDIGLEDNKVLIEFTVSDTGIGMSEEFLHEKLYQKFAQEESDITSPYDGCGTGLAITKHLVELMNGTIDCVSEKGKGTTFTFTIPAELVQRRRKRAHREHINYDLSGVNVLLCEDNPMNQKMEKDILERMNCEVHIAEDGAIGVQLFKESENNYYSIVLMDIRMPNMDGLEATREIRELDRQDAKAVPILAVSANAFEKDVKKSLDAGMNEHLAKPVGAKILYEKIMQYTKR